MTFDILKACHVSFAEYVTFIFLPHHPAMHHTEAPQQYCHLPQEGLQHQLGITQLGTDSSIYQRTRENKIEGIFF